MCVCENHSAASCVRDHSAASCVRENHAASCVRESQCSVVCEREDHSAASCVRERECVCVCVCENHSAVSCVSVCRERITAQRRVCVREDHSAASCVCVCERELVVKHIRASSLCLSRDSVPLGFELMIKLMTLLTVFTLKAEAGDYGKGRYFPTTA